MFFLQTGNVSIKHHVRVVAIRKQDRGRKVTFLFRKPLQRTSRQASTLDTGYKSCVCWASKAQ